MSEFANAGLCICACGLVGLIGHLGSCCWCLRAFVFACRYVRVCVCVWRVECEYECV